MTFVPALTQDADALLLGENPTLDNNYDAARRGGQSSCTGDLAKLGLCRRGCNLLKIFQFVAAIRISAGLTPRRGTRRVYSNNDFTDTGIIRIH